jgi:prepilin-type N-terminal cleavage/methylation domain-containing protein/prepilin-type processing-associated H-X9-DG protein
MPLGAAKSRQTGQGGFTLVELLVVVTIIVVLTGMLIPAIHEAVQSGQETLCASNLRQLDFAFTGYITDHFGAVFGLHHSFDQVWMEQIQPYAAELNSLMFCPRARHPSSGESRGDVSSAWTGRYRTGSKATALHRGTEYHEGSYAFNGWLYNVDSSSVGIGSQLGLKEDRFFNDLMNLESYVSTPVFADGVWFNGWPEKEEHDVGIGTSVFDIPRHRSTVSIVFLDGHAAQVSLADLYYMTWHVGFEPGPRGEASPR